MSLRIATRGCPENMSTGCGGWALRCAAAIPATTKNAMTFEQLLRKACLVRIDFLSAVGTAAAFHHIALDLQSYPSRTNTRAPSLGINREVADSACSTPQRESGTIQEWIRSFAPSLCA